MKNKIAIQASNNIEENKEIIKIFESLGGNNDSLSGNTSNHSCYYIRKDNTIGCSFLNYYNEFLKDYKLYTLEEYKKEFMESREIKITPPEGYEIDKKNSTFEKIVFKKVEEKLTYEKIAEKLFTFKKHYYTNEFGTIKETASRTTNLICFLDPNNAPTYDQLARLLALNKLMNVSYYLNDGWEPDWNDTNISKYCLFYDHNLKKILIDYNLNHHKTSVYFKSSELAQQAVEILGEETIKLALGV